MPSSPLPIPARILALLSSLSNSTHRSDRSIEWTTPRPIDFRILDLHASDGGGRPNEKASKPAKNARGPFFAFNFRPPLDSRRCGRRRHTIRYLVARSITRLTRQYPHSKSIHSGVGGRSGGCRRPPRHGRACLPRPGATRRKRRPWAIRSNAAASR